jgi:hypothetical protein
MACQQSLSVTFVPDCKGFIRWIINHDEVIFGQASNLAKTYWLHDRSRFLTGGGGI